MESIPELVVLLRAADDAGREMLREKLFALCVGENGDRHQDDLRTLARGEVLEVQWEIEEVLEQASPPEPPPEKPSEDEPEDEPDANDGKLSAADLEMVYQDPRGLVLHRTKAGERWFATQVDPQTGQPGTFELQRQEVDSLKSQLAGSPYWLLGKGSRDDVKMP